MDKNQVYRFVVLTHPHTPLEGLGGGGVNCCPSGSCVKMERVDPWGGGGEGRLFTLCGRGIDSSWSWRS